jgi:hypothetical protein
VGDPNAVTRQIIEQRAASGSRDVLVIRPEVGTMSVDEVGDGLGLLAREVLPVVRSLQRRSRPLPQPSPVNGGRSRLSRGPSKVPGLAWRAGVFAPGDHVQERPLAASHAFQGPV